MKKKILVIDDEEILTKTLAHILGKRDYEVSTASRAEDALALAEGGRFDLVLCDIRMPGKNGVETIRDMKALLQSKGETEPPVIFLTGFADPKLQQEAQTLNPVAYVYKPFDTITLLDMIESTLAAA